MEIAFVQRAAFGQVGMGAGQTSPAMATTTGNLLVAMFQAIGMGTGMAAVTDTAGNTYVDTGVALDAASSLQWRMWYAENITGNAANQTVGGWQSGTAIYGTIVVHEISGAATSGALNTTSTGEFTSSTSWATGTLTIAAAQEIVIAFCAASAASGVTVGTGYAGTNFAISGDANPYWLDEYHVITASEPASATQGSANFFSGIAASFKAVAPTGKLFRENSLSGIGAGGPFFHNPLSAPCLAPQSFVRRDRIFVPSYLEHVA